MSVLTRFQSHDLQIVLALFLSKPELYADYKSQRNLQDYFFTKFLKFAGAYFQSTDPETYVYFGSVATAAAGSVSVCTGMGKISGASKSYFKSRAAADAKLRETHIKEFERKYRIQFEKSDPRTYLGETEIWKKLDRAAEIVAKSSWPNVAQMEYSDETFTTPIPDSMDKRLVPMQIRNKVCQKHLSKTKISASAYRAPVDFTKQDAEEEAEFLNKKVAPAVTRPGFDLQEEDLDW